MSTLLAWSALCSDPVSSWEANWLLYAFSDHILYDWLWSILIDWPWFPSVSFLLILFSCSLALSLSLSLTPTPSLVTLIEDVSMILTWRRRTELGRPSGSASKDLCLSIIRCVVSTYLSLSLSLSLFLSLSLSPSTQSQPISLHFPSCRLMVSESSLRESPLQGMSCLHQTRWGS